MVEPMRFDLAHATYAAQAVTTKVAAPAPATLREKARDWAVADWLELVEHLADVYGTDYLLGIGLLLLFTSR